MAFADFTHRARFTASVLLAALSTPLLGPFLAPSPACATTAIRFALDRKIDGTGRALLCRHRQGLLQGRRARRYHRCCPRRSAGSPEPPRHRQGRYGRFRHQPADQIPRCQRRADQGRVHRVRQAPLCHHGAQEPRHRGAAGFAGQEARSACDRSDVRAVADLRQGRRHRHREGRD